MTTIVRPEAEDRLNDESAREGPSTVSPEALIERHVENARHQLADGRERLKAARRRVVQLEEAVHNWERLAAEMRANRARNVA